MNDEQPSAARTAGADPARPATGGVPADRYPGRRPGRYPGRRRRPLIIALVAAVALVGLGWLVWAALGNSNPTVSGAVHIWHIQSDEKVTFTLTVDRPDPSVPVACRVIAQASNFETVGDKTVEVGPSTAQVADVQDSLRTIRRATSVSLSRCWVQS